MAADLLRRMVIVDPAQMQLLSMPGAQGADVLEYRITGALPARIQPGTILVGAGLGQVGWEVRTVNLAGDVARIEVLSVDLTPVREVPPMPFHVPLSSAAGTGGGVSWGPWRMVNLETGETLAELQIPPGAQSVDFDLPFDWEKDLCDGLIPCGGGQMLFRVHLALRGSLDGSFDFGDCFDPTSIFCTFRPIDEIGVSLDESFDAEASLHVLGDFLVDQDIPVPYLGLSRDFDLGVATGKVTIGLVVGIVIDIDDVDIQPHAEFHQSLETGAHWTPEAGFTFPFDLDFDASAGWGVTSTGEGFAKLRTGPKVAVGFSALGYDFLHAEAGAFAFLRGTLDISGPAPECENWHAGVDVGVEALANYQIDLLIWDFGDGTTWDRPYPLVDFWGTGDVRVATNTMGVDIDPNGYLVALERTHPNDAPAKTGVMTEHVTSTGFLSFEGGSCQDLKVFCDPCGITGCDLVATEHDISLADVMWNCAVSGENDRTFCIHPNETSMVSYDVNCVSVFEAAMNIIDSYANDGWIDGHGIVNSMDAKLRAAQAARDRGDGTAAQNMLDAFIHEVSAQCGKAIDASICEDLTEKANQMKGYCTSVASAGGVLD